MYTFCIELLWKKSEIYMKEAKKRHRPRPWLSPHLHITNSTFMLTMSIGQTLKT